LQFDVRVPVEVTLFEEIKMVDLKHEFRESLGEVADEIQRYVDKISTLHGLHPTAVGEVVEEGKKLVADLRAAAAGETSPEAEEVKYDPALHAEGVPEHHQPEQHQPAATGRRKTWWQRQQEKIKAEGGEAHEPEPVA
jgi:hypothetical protein